MYRQLHKELPIINKNKAKQTLPLYTEMYRSGHNGADSKSVVRLIPYRGFESHRLRQKKAKVIPQGVAFAFYKIYHLYNYEQQKTDNGLGCVVCFLKVRFLIWEHLILNSVSLIYYQIYNHIILNQQERYNMHI